MQGPACSPKSAQTTNGSTACNYADAVRTTIGRQALDISYNPVGGNTFGQDRKLLGTGSRLFLYGGAQLGEGKFGPLSQLYFLAKMGGVIPIFLSLQSKSLIGVNVLQLADAQPAVFQTCLDAIVQLYAGQRIKPQNGGNFQHTQLPRAHQWLESGQSIGKITVSWL